MSKEDKYWEYDEIENNYKLHFIRFYEDEIIATVFEDEEFSEFYADYELENVPKVEGEPYVLDAETIELFGNAKHCRIGSILLVQIFLMICIMN
jgi:hypothetical protein|nr:MAG TPA: hypothetical protein [Caudoviricetes sp.]